MTHPAEQQFLNKLDKKLWTASVSLELRLWHAADQCPVSFEVLLSGDDYVHAH